MIASMNNTFKLGFGEVEVKISQLLVYICKSLVNTQIICKNDIDAELPNT